eukprot:tig00000093_g3619.t1
MSDLECKHGREKRIRTRLEEPLAAASPLQQAVGTFTFDALPDAVVSEVFRSLGLQASWSLRGVCRRWRRIIEETEWPSFELRTDEDELAYGKHVHAGASIELGPDWLEMQSACSLLSALVIFEVLGSEQCDERFGNDFLADYLRRALQALRPPEGAASVLEGLHLYLSNGQYAPMMLMPLPPAAELRAALAPLGQLRSLTLLFPLLDNGLLPEDAAAIAAACPLLRSLSARPELRLGSAVVAALAPLARLERLAVLLDIPEDYKGAPEELVELDGGLAALADGPAGESLRTIHFLHEELVDGRQLLYGEESFPRLSDADLRSYHFSSVRVSDDALRALSRMPRLECVEPLRFRFDRVSPAAVRALGRTAALQRLHLRVAGSMRSGLEDGDSDADEDDDAGTDPGDAFAALAGALSALPSLSRLRLELVSCKATRPEHVAGLLTSAGARRALAELDLSVHARRAPFSEAEAEAIAALPRLERLRLSLAPSYLRPFEILGRLPREVAVKADLKNAARGLVRAPDLADARAQIDRLLAGRRPYPSP